MISVIVPVYKVEPYLKKCVYSILAQTYTDYELILVDDGSPDSCGRICDELALIDSRIKVIHQINGGQCNARNNGLNISRGDYIAFVDSDDSIHPEMLATAMRLIKKADIAILGHQIVREGYEIDLKSKNVEDEFLSEEELWDEIFKKLNNAAWNKLYKRELIDKLRFESSLLHGEDLIFNILYLTRCKTGAINNAPFYNYLKRNNSITTSAFSDRRLNELSSKDFARDLIMKHKPELLDYADLFCYRARMNVMRSIYKANKEHLYSKELHSISSYVTKHHNDISQLMNKKERIEFILFSYFPLLYKAIVKNIN